jgi:hypothetical protein
MNFAFIGRPDQYHTMLSTPAALELGSLQHMGDQVLAAVHVLDARVSLRAPGPRLIWGDLFQRVVIYGNAVGWGLLAVCALALVLATRRLAREGSKPSLGRGAASMGLVVLLGGVLLSIARPLAITLVDRESFARLFGAYLRIEAGYVLIAVGVLLLAASLLRSREAGHSEPTWIGALVILLVLAIVLQATSPALTPVIVWPLVPACVAAAIGARFVLLFALAVALPFAHAVFLGVGMLTGAALVPFLLVVGCCLYPLHTGLPKRLAPLFVVAGLLVMIFVRLS